jgi:hypothetical protein
MEMPPPQGSAAACELPQARRRCGRGRHR